MLLRKLMLVLGAIVIAQSNVSMAEVLQNCECGRSNSPLKVRIVGGNETTPHAYPWTVAILSKANIVCGGSIISDRHILTAGHCVTFTNPLQLTIRVGMHSSQLLEGQLHTVAECLIHPDFEELEHYDLVDVAVLKTKSAIVFSDTVRPVCLPATSTLRYGHRSATIAGWGRLAENKGAAVNLQEARVRVLTPDECKQSPIRKVFRDDMMMCALAPGMDACQGDSGGPLVLESVFNRFEQIGVISFGTGCGTNAPGIYVPVTYVLPFLSRTIQKANVCRDPASNN